MLPAVTITITDREHGKIVRVAFAGTVSDLSITVPVDTTMIEAIALVAVDLRMNGLPDAVLRARDWSDHGPGRLLYASDL